MMSWNLSLQETRGLQPKSKMERGDQWERGCGISPKNNAKRKQQECKISLLNMIYYNNCKILIYSSFDNSSTQLLSFIANSCTRTTHHYYRTLDSHTTMGICIVFTSNCLITLHLPKINWRTVNSAIQNNTLLMFLPQNA